MKIVFECNVVDKSYSVIEHNVDDRDAPVLAASLTRMDYPSVALDQGGVTHFTLDPSECPHCHRIIREHLGL